MFRRLDGYVTEEKLNLVKLAAGKVAETRTCASQIVGASLSIPAASAALLTISQSTFGVMPWPQICPDLLIALKRPVSKKNIRKMRPNGPCRPSGRIIRRHGIGRRRLSIEERTVLHSDDGLHDGL